MPFLPGQYIWQFILENDPGSASHLHQQKPFAFLQSHGQGPAGLWVPSDQHLPYLMVKSKSAGGRRPGADPVGRDMQKKGGVSVCTGSGRCCGSVLRSREKLGEGQVRKDREKELASGWKQEGRVGRVVIGGKQRPKEAGREPGTLPRACLLGRVLLCGQSQSGYFKQ